VISCDNLPANGAKLEQAILLFAERTEPGLSTWIQKNVRFPETVVDCMVPATSPEACARVDTQLGLHDAAPVERENYAQWVIARHFAGPVPDWQVAGAEIVDDVKGYERLKLHVLNLVHSAVAYLGLQRGYTFVRQAIRDEDISRYAEALVTEEIAPALSPLPVMEYWKKTLARLRNPNLDHQLSKIAEDGSLKLALRAFPLLEYNYSHGLPLLRLAGVVRAWMSFAAQGPVRDPYSAELSAWARAGADRNELLKHPLIFPDAFRREARLRAAITDTDLLIPALRDIPC
jgi:fructuronate reductase